MDAVESQTAQPQAVQLQTAQRQTPQAEAGAGSISSQVPDPAALVRSRATLGDFELTVCTDGTYLLDGGAMFGVVPKTLWQKRIPADGENRILLGLNSVVVRTGRHTVLIETGIGNKQSPRMREIHANQELLPSSLAAAGVRLEEIDIVINSHLHFDHCGWNTTLQPDGSVTPTFPNARYFAHAGEVAHGHLQLERDAVSYLSPNYDPLIESGQMTLLTTTGIHENPEIVPGISVELFPGHTAQTLGIHIESRSHGGAAEHACYISDLIPTASHLDPTWVMGYDLDPLTCIAERKRFYQRAIPEKWLVLFTHDHHTPAARIGLNDKGRPVVER
jgi:glyoxylase-like metal-dependent hydrolase (beta-lactamase superfamily II)